MRARLPIIIIALALFVPRGARAQAFGRATEEPLSYDTLVEGALAARQAGDLEKSLALLRRAFALEPTPGLRHNIGRLLEELGRYREAIDEYAAAMAHPNAGADLVKRDEESIARLTPRLSRAWIRIAFANPVLLDGSPAPRDTESGTAPGTHMLEAALDTGEVLVRSISAPAGVRTVVTIDARAAQKDTASISLEGAPRTITRVAIDGYSVRADPATLQRVRVDPGAHRLRVELSDRPGIDTAITLGAGAPYLAREWIAAEPEKNGARLGPLLTGGAGLLAAAGGVALLAAAHSGRAEIEGAARDERGYVTGLTLAEADRIESRSAREAGAGVVLIAAGAGAIIGGTLWWLFSSPGDL